jgi:uncharacterized surface protein with fasciclin (FAS1) repeats
MGMIMALTSVSAPAPAAAQQPLSGKLTGNILFRPRATIATDAQVSVKLLQMLRDLPPLAIATEKLTLTGNIASLPYEINYDPSFIDPDGLYYVDVLVTEGDEITYITTGDTYVLTRGYPAIRLDVVVRSARPVQAIPVSTSAASRSMLDVLSADPRFKIMRSLVEEAGLSQALSDGSAQMTLFAPTDEAFLQLPPSVLPALRRDPEQLRKMLQYHMLRVRLTASDVTKAEALNTLLDGQAMKILTRNGAAVLDSQARVSRAEVQTRNGNIFAVTKVLVPPEVMSAIGQ